MVEQQREPALEQNPEQAGEQLLDRSPIDLFALQEYYITARGKRTLTSSEERQLSDMIHAGQTAMSRLGASTRTNEPLDATTEAAPTNEVRTGLVALEVFVLANKPLAVRLATIAKSRNADNHRVEKEDLVQAALLQLTRCALTYKPKEGKRFSSLAYPSITLKLISFVEDYGRLIKRPRNTTNAVEHFNSMLTAGVTPEEAAASVKISLRTLARAEEALRYPDATSYDASVRLGEQTGTPLIDLLDSHGIGAAESTDRAQEKADALLASAGLRKWLAERANRISGQKDIDPDRAYNILLAHYGHGRSYTDIAKEHGIARERVGQIVRATIKAIKQNRATDSTSRVQP